MLSIRKSSKKAQNPVVATIDYSHQKKLYSVAFTANEAEGQFLRQQLWFKWKKKSF